MDFGLGLVLSFTDNATAGINNAVNTLNQLTQTAEKASSSLNEMASLSALSVVSGQLGNSFTSMGSNIISTLGQVISRVNDTGQTLMYAENQLDLLYKSSGKSGSQVIDQIQDYAKKSIFEFEDLISVVTQLKSVGIEAFDSIASSAGNAYDIMSLSSDLAAFNPNMKNAYGTGINAAMGALKEYIAEGNALSLKRGAGLDITSILGEDKGSTIEERSRQVADLLEQLGMVGMTAQLAESPMTKLSNMSDTLFQFLGMVSNSGVYDKFNELITKFADYVMAIPDEELESIAKTVGSALTAILQPLEWVVDKVLGLADSIRQLVANNPQLVKIATVGVAIAGVLLVLAGVALKFTSAFSGISLMLLTMGKSFSSIGGIVKTGALKMLGTLLPLTATIGLMYLAWKNDFAGIRTNTTYFVDSLVTSFKTAYKAVNGSVSDLTTTLTELRNKDDFFSNLTIGIMKVMMFAKALSDAWGDYTLSEENFLKAKELGILPLIEAILDLKYRFGLFMQGFLDGWREIGDTVKNIVMGFLDNIKGTALEGLVDVLTDFLQKLSGGDAQAWYDFGQSFADFTALALTLWGAFKLIGGVIGIFTKIAGVFKTLWTIFGGVFKVIKLVVGVFGKIGGAISTVLTVIGGVVSAILGFFGIVVTAPAWLVGAITLAVVAIVALIIKYRDKIWEVLSAIGTWIYDNVIQPIANFFVNLWNDIVTGVQNAIDGIMNFFSGVGIWIYDNVITPVADFFTSLWDGIVTGVSNAIDNVKNFFASLPEFFSGVWSSIVSLFSTIGTVVADAVSGAVKGAINAVLSGAVIIINGFISAINTAIGVINAIPGVSINKLSKLEVPQLAQGAIIDKPTLSVVGEAGTEAVMPLENNTSWIGRLADMLYTEMNDIVPTNSNHISSSGNQGSAQRYLTTNNNNSQTIQGDTDNSVVFNEGAIQIIVQNATEAEAIRLAKMVMEYIKRQQELDRMVKYA